MKKIKVIFIFLLVVIFSNVTNISHSFDLKEMKTKNNQNFKIVQLTDLHFQEVGGTNTNRQIGNSKALLETAISEINKIENLDTVLISGDMINKPIENELHKFLNSMTLLKFSWYAVIGNHDVACKLTKQKYMDILHNANSNIPNRSYYIVHPKPNWAIIALDGVKPGCVNGEFDAKQLKWLDNQLFLNKKNHVIIFEHHPVIEPYKSSTHKVLNDTDYFNVINKHKNVVAVLAGHYHAAKIDKYNNVAFIVTPSLVQFPNAYRILTFEECANKIIITTETRQVNYPTVKPMNVKSCKEDPKSCGSEEDRNSKLEINRIYP